MGAIITNIITAGSQLRVFLSINGVEETRLFEPSPQVVNEIKSWAQERTEYYADLEKQAAELREQLTNFEIN